MEENKGGEITVENKEGEITVSQEENEIESQGLETNPNTCKGGNVPRRKKEHTIRFTRTEEKISEEDEIQIEELEVHNTMVEAEKGGLCGTNRGPHIILLSFFYIPCALISSMCVSFYYGAWTWFNLYLFFSEEKTVWHKVTICPLLILTFPFTVGLSSIFIAVFAAFIQLSWYFRSWRNEIVDFDKGFYGWLCDKIGLSQCSPYEMITLNDESELENLPIRS